MSVQINLIETKTMSSARQSSYPIDPQFLTRWSPRAYDSTPLHEEELMTILEAARWAPSAYNVQPWRFIYSLREDENWDLFLSLLDPFNAAWARDSGALVFLLSSRVVPGTNPPKPFPSHSFDAGAAWIQLALQAQTLGFQAHAMGGIFRDQIRKELVIPDQFQIEIGIAIGQPGSPGLLPEYLRDREKPSSRMPLSDLVSMGRMAPVELDRGW